MKPDKLDVVVIVFEHGSSKILRQTTVDFLTHNGRKFIAKTAWWAMHEGHTLRTRPRYDWEIVDEIDRRA